MQCEKCSAAHSKNTVSHFRVELLYTLVRYPCEPTPLCVNGPLKISSFSLKNSSKFRHKIYSHI